MTIFRKILVSYILAVAFFLPSDSVFAQVNIPAIGESGLSEKSLRQSQPELKRPPKVDAPEIVVIKDSRSLADAGEGPSFFVRRIEVELNTIFDDEALADVVDLGGGTDLTLGILALMAQEVEAYYSMRGYFLTKAYIPEQKISNGVVRMVVSEGQIAKIEVTGNKKIRNKDFTKRMKAVQGARVLSEQTLERVLMELNDLLGVSVRSVLKPGDLPGTSNLILEVTETNPYTFAFDADNFGSAFTGKNRFGVSTSVANILTLGDQVFFRGVRSNLGQNLASLSYLFPFTDSGRTTLRFSHTFSEQQLGASLSALNAGGQTHIFNIEMAHALWRTRDSQIKLKMGFDSKDFRNFQLGNLATNDEIRDVYFGVSGNMSDRFQGKSFFDLTVQRGISGTDKKSPKPSRAGGDSTITIARLNLTRFQGTSFMDSYFVFKAAGQVTSARVLSPDQTSIGGFGTVRGYPLSEVAGDWGLTTSAEYFIPVPWKLPLGFDGVTLDRVLSVTGFIEHGQIFVLGNQAGEKQESLSSAGWGIQVNVPKAKKGWRPAVSFSVSQAFPIEGPMPTDRSSNVLYVNGAINFN